MSETIVRIKGQTQCVYELRVARQRIAALEAEVERLRGALARLLLATHDSYSPTCDCDICRAVEVGRAELEPQP